MTTFKDVFALIEEFQRTETEVASTPFFILLTGMNKDSETLDPIEFGTLTDFASDQAARWLTRWHFSPSASPDENARAEAAAWQELLERWTDTMEELAPGTRKLNIEGHSLRCVTLAIRRGLDARPGRAQRLGAEYTSHIAILLDRIGLGPFAKPLMTLALYPAGTVGRTHPGPP